MNKTEVKMPGKKIGYPLSSKQSSGQTKQRRSDVKMKETTKGFPSCHD